MFDPNDPLFWTVFAFVAFIALLAYNRVPTVVIKALDDRADGISKELDEARSLHEEAQVLLSTCQYRVREAEKEAELIVEQAKCEAEALAIDSRKALAESLGQRLRIVEEKIARTEAQALSEIRSTAVKTALAATHEILKSWTVSSTGEALLYQSIRDLRVKLN